MAFKMKGNPMQRNFGIGKSPAKAQGIFKTLPDGAKKRIGKDEAKQMEEQDLGYLVEETGDDIKTIPSNENNSEQTIKALARINKIKLKEKTANTPVDDLETNKEISRKKDNELQAKANLQTNKKKDSPADSKSPAKDKQPNVKGHNTPRESELSHVTDKHDDRERFGPSPQPKGLKKLKKKSPGKMYGKKSPAKCPLLALAGPIMGMLGKKKE